MNDLGQTIPTMALITISFHISNARLGELAEFEKAG